MYMHGNSKRGTETEKEENNVKPKHICFSLPEDLLAFLDFLSASFEVLIIA